MNVCFFFFSVTRKWIDLRLAYLHSLKISLQQIYLFIYLFIYHITYLIRHY
ncbi:MAG: hypothetical protein N7Q72_06290 [Spiroplasma sp. Tabriz.8]|nr:hypothetical protein [Spiroplasma sp. Tabriz.8]